ncbi:hypothetical protein [Roseobacter sp. N2S]|uniref:Acb2/Tad1 domain-containing protein n=1 Tax=Roseobacter sp. N2S TaxID=2663844 RepID=UPI002860245E|nr:hypothetical protein [Roseobacter sp. N2S]MDR6266556.1 hypothetical protein [Roseobacter sp. N2S]
MGHVIINSGPVMGVNAPINTSAMDIVRLRFNPSNLEQVDCIKSLAAALISQCEAIRDAGGPGAREAAKAITDVQSASMFAVAAATAGL